MRKSKPYIDEYGDLVFPLGYGVSLVCSNTVPAEGEQILGYAWYPEGATSLEPQEPGWISGERFGDE